MKLMTFFRNKLSLLAGSTLFYIGNALADLPPIEQPSTGGGAVPMPPLKGICVMD